MINNAKNPQLEDTQGKIIKKKQLFDDEGDVQPQGGLFKNQNDLNKPVQANK